MILEWDELNPLYSVIITITPETQVDINSRSTARLTVAYNILYNISVIVSHPCGQSSVTVFSEVYYYPHTNARECSTSVFLRLSKLIALISADVIITCGNPEAQVADSVTVSGYTDPVVEGTTVTFHSWI